MPLKLPPSVLAFFQKTGAKGGKARAAKHSKKQLSAWGKLGGRPKGRRNKQGKKGGK